MATASPGVGAAAGREPAAGRGGYVEEARLVSGQGRPFATYIYISIVTSDMSNAVINVHEMGAYAFCAPSPPRHGSSRRLPMRGSSPCLGQPGTAKPATLALRRVGTSLAR